jgi:hypothetical protein
MSSDRKADACISALWDILEAHGHRQLMDALQRGREVYDAYRSAPVAPSAVAPLLPHGILKLLLDIEGNAAIGEPSWDDIGPRIRASIGKLMSAPQSARERRCPYCTSDNEGIRSTYYDQTCEGCVKRMVEPADRRATDE